MSDCNPGLEPVGAFAHGSVHAKKLAWGSGTLQREHDIIGTWPKISRNLKMFWDLDTRPS